MDQSHFKFSENGEHLVCKECGARYSLMFSSWAENRRWRNEHNCVADFHTLGKYVTAPIHYSRQAGKVTAQQLWNYGEVIRQDILENILKATAAVRDNPNPYGMSHADHTLAHEILVKEKAMPQEVENEKPCDWAAGCGNAARHKLIYADRKSTHVRFLCDDHLGGVVSDLSRRNSSGFDPVVNMSVRAAQIKHETVTRTVTRYIW